MTHCVLNYMKYLSFMRLALRCSAISGGTGSCCCCCWRTREDPEDTPEEKGLCLRAEEEEEEEGMAWRGLRRR